MRTCSGEGGKNSKWYKSSEIHFESRREDGVLQDSAILVLGGCSVGLSR